MYSLMGFKEKRDKQRTRVRIKDLLLMNQTIVASSTEVWKSEI